MEPVHVFDNAAIYGLPVPEIPLDNQEDMLHFASDRRLSVLYFLIPVDAVIFVCDLKA